MFICFGKCWLNKGREDEVSWEKIRSGNRPGRPLGAYGSVY